MENISTLIGLEGGSDATWYKILTEEGRGKTKYYPSLKDGKALHYDDPNYWQYKTERERETVRLIVAGNPVSAESELARRGYRALAIGPTTLDVYVDEEFAQKEA